MINHRRSTANVPTVAKPESLEIGQIVIVAGWPHKWQLADFLTADAYREYVRDDLDSRGHYDAPLPEGGTQVAWALLEQLPNRSTKPSAGMRSVVVHLNQIRVLESTVPGQVGQALRRF